MGIGARSMIFGNATAITVLGNGSRIFPVFDFSGAIDEEKDQFVVGDPS
jgi:hypothetical protein